MQSIPDILIRSGIWGKIILAIASFLLYSMLWSWQISIVFLIGLSIHEYGHLWAMRRSGMKPSGFYLIPFVGGIIFSTRSNIPPYDEAFIASMGPAFGLAAIFPCFLLANILMPWPEAVTSVMMLAGLNLFNLFPIFPMDGGRIVRAILSGSKPNWVKPAALGGAFLAVILAVVLRAWILLLIIAMSWSEITHTRRRVILMDKKYVILCSASYGALIAFAVAIIFICVTQTSTFSTRG